jgi:hypothetical protein
MDRETRLRRVGILCCSFIRNYAYYEAGWDGKTSKANNDYLKTVQGNFIDISVLEWWKLFGDYNDKHHWKKIIDKPSTFKKEMLEDAAITEEELSICRKTFKAYRDKFLAHLDSDDIMNIPEFDIALSVVKFYYNKIAIELGASGLRNFPADIERYYKKCFSESEEYFRN